MPTPAAERFITIHGHFYQPPRENPWLDMVEVQDSAYPYHDWNERITAECYGPNAVARILGADGRIARLVNNYARISYNVGPTLLAWLEEKAPDVYQAILDADRESHARFGGHGSAMAQVYNHVILPLSSPADKVTQVVWGIRDFTHRFGRDPEGMWLAETAVDVASLEVLAEHGIRFTVLAPTQANRVRPRDGDEWTDVPNGKIDPTRAYLQKLPSGRSIALFFYNGPLSRAVAFEHLLRDGAGFASRLLGAFADRPGPQLVHLATDGESYGHHHPHGDMALAYALEHIEASGKAKLTCYGEFLERYPPQHEVEILENTAWSCAHGIDRWRADCGCNSGRAGWHQRWRKPLRDALDGLSEAVRPPYEEHAGAAFTDPWAARNDYVQVLLDPTPESQDRFLDARARKQLDAAGRVRALELLELQRHAQLMYTSCGWFFDEVSGLETTQILLYAGRVIQLAEKLFDGPFEEPFLAALEKAPSNLPEHATGRAVYEKFVRPTKVDKHHVGAHYAVSSLFEDYPRRGRLFCYDIDRHDEQRFEAGKVRMVVGHATLTALPTQERWEFAYAAVHMGDHNVNGGVSVFPGDESYQSLVKTFADAFSRVDTPQILRLMDRHFGESTASVGSLFRDEQRKVLKRLLQAGLRETMELYSRLFSQSQPLMRFLKHLQVPLPLPLRAATEVLFNTDLRWAFTDDDPDFTQIRLLVAEASEWGVHLDVKGLGYKFSKLLDRAAERWREAPLQVELLQTLLSGIDLGRELPFELNLWKAQNVFFELAQTTYPDLAELSAAGNEPARLWVEKFLLLGEALHVEVEPIKKKLTELRSRPTVPDLVAELSAARRVPLATYRLQMTAGFPFTQAAGVVPYLAALGVSDVYLSPILQARPGSQHGYDICDHSRVNPELGGEAGLDALAEVLKREGMGMLLDVVPNHMAVGHVANRWWSDVLENGSASGHAGYFDIDWDPINPDLADKVLLPTLGEQYGQALESGKFRLAYERGGFTLSYYETTWPIAPGTYNRILASRLDFLAKRLPENDDHLLEYRSVLTSVENLPSRSRATAHRRSERYREIAILKRRLAALVEASPDVRAAIDSALELFNGKVGNPQSFDLLDGLIAAQPYRPAFWRVAMDEINYRRFFDVNDLAAIRTEVPEVFRETHEIPLRLLAEGKATGLRIDHPDGLHDPTRYFRQLQESFALARVKPRVEKYVPKDRVPGEVNAALDGLARAGKPWPLYVVAEKILGDDEALPRDWAVDGTTGYDFLNAVNGLFVDGANAARMERVYADFTGQAPAFEPLVIGCKKMIMQVSMASEINSLSHQLDRLAERNRRYRDFTLNTLTDALREVIACLPVYRTYTTEAGEVSDRDRAFVQAACEEAKHRNPRTAEAVFDFLRDTVLLRNLDQFPEPQRRGLIDWVLRFQQITGPVMAKGIEDTAFYVYNRLASLNEVGGHPHHFGVSVAAFHEQNQDRAEHWPHAMLASSTHDTKRSEDLRARLNVLSEVPDEWERQLRQWAEWHAPLVARLDGEEAPSANDRYLFYQTLLGAWPEGDLDADAFASLRKRLVEYMQKATKEAKQHTSWLNADAGYDDAVRRFVEGVMTDDAKAPFRPAFAKFQKRVAFFGRVNALVQLVFRLTSPGVPDVYQGCELWDYSLVDPDNRRPVDYDRRKKLLAELRKGADVRDLLRTVEDGRIKLFVTATLLGLRKGHPDVFQGGRYAALAPTGEKATGLCAYARQGAQRQVLVAGCIRPVGVAGGATVLPVGDVWGDTFVPWPGLPAGTAVRDVFTGAEVVLAERNGQVGVAAAEAQATLPFSVLLANGERGVSPLLCVPNRGLTPRSPIHVRLLVAQLEQRPRLLDAAGLEPALEPAHPLRRRAVRERVGHDPAARLLLQVVVADLVRRVQGRLDVAGVEEVVLPLPVVRPDAGEVVGLQLQPHRHLVVLGLRHRLPGLVHAGGVAEQPLDVVADLVGDDVGAGELAGRLQLVLHVLVERQVDVDLAVAGAVERPDRRVGRAARRLDGAAEQHQRRLLVTLARLGEQVAPDPLGVAEDHLGELGELLLGRVDRPLLDVAVLVALLLGAAALVDDAAELLRIDAEHQRQQHDEDTSSADGDAGLHRRPAAVLDVLALLAVFPLHWPVSRWKGLTRHCRGRYS
ncbi:MAG: malto-oligosyltrehalose synthase [Gemmataceae bacterium]